MHVLSLHSSELGLTRRELWWREPWTESVRRPRLRLKCPSSAMWDRQGNPSFESHFSHPSSEFWGLKGNNVQFVKLCINSSILIQTLFSMLLLSQFTIFGLFFKGVRKDHKICYNYQQKLSRQNKGSVVAWSCWGKKKNPCCWDTFNHGLQSSSCDWGDCQMIPLLSVWLW